MVDIISYTISGPVSFSYYLPLKQDLLYWEKCWLLCVGQKARRDADRCSRTKRRLLVFPKGKAICLIWAKLSGGGKPLECCSTTIRALTNLIQFQMNNQKSFKVRGSIPLGKSCSCGMEGWIMKSQLQSLQMSHFMLRSEWMNEEKKGREGIP